MQTSLLTKLESLVERRRELDALLAAPEIIADHDRFRALSREHAELGPLAACFARYRQARASLAGAEELAAGDDAELRALAREEIAELGAHLETLEDELQRLLVPRDPDDEANVFLEIRAGTGGEEAALFAADLLRMYLRYAEQRGWRCEIMSAHESEQGGFKEVIVKINGSGVYARLKFESGAHRV